MQAKIRISQNVQELLRCPICHSKLQQVELQFECTDSNCAARFPIVNGIPVLINEQSSIFSIADFVAHGKPFFENVSGNSLVHTIRRLLPDTDKNIKAQSNYNRLNAILFEQSTSPRVLVIGGSVLGLGMDSLANNPALDLVESDVSFGPRTMLIFDAHDIPFEDESFDGVIAQAVLEHVVDPYRCSEEIYRVLNKDGVVYAETPFMQQVHGGRYDFTRFTHLGHRRLFRKFEEIDSGAVAGPGMALAWSYKYFLLSFSTSWIIRAFIKAFTNLTTFYLKYFDHLLIDKSGTLDSASGYYFMGRKSETVLSDRELIKLYKGAG